MLESGEYVISLVIGGYIKFFKYLWCSDGFWIYVYFMMGSIIVIYGFYENVNINVFVCFIGIKGYYFVMNMLCFI